MASSGPYCFRLIPQNDAAKCVVFHSRNADFSEKSEMLSLRVALGHTPRRHGTLLTVGDSSCDICLPGRTLPHQLQCQFRFHPETGELILRDDSPDRTTRLISEAKPSHKYSLQGRPRQRVIVKDVRPSLYIYDIVFRLDFPGKKKEIKHDAIMKFVKRHGQQSPMHSSPTTRPQNLSKGERLPYTAAEFLGKGGFAEVFRITDLRTGDYFAMKVFRVHEHDGESREEKLKRFQN
jgi:hypothetical protein